MSKIDEFIAEFCPEGVMTTALGGLVKERQSRAGADSNLPVFGISNSLGFVATDKIFSTSRASADRSNYKVVHPNDFAYNPSRINVGSIAMLKEDSDALVSPMYKVLSIGPKLNPRYLEIFVRSSLFQSQVLSSIEVGARFRFTFDSLAKIRVPVPPLEVQREIVSILDNFTQLEAELEAELEARKLQFTYFVDRIFDLHGSHDAPSKPLQSVCRITRASGLEKSQLQAEGLPVVQYGEIHMHYDTVATKSRSFADQFIANKLQKANPGDVVLVTTSEDVKDVGNPLVWMGSTSIGVGGESLILQHDLDPVYLGMFFKSNSFYSQKLPYVNGSKVKRISTSNLQKILIPVPELRVQKILGENLLALENLVKSANDGLPAEITARRKQYEHYRNKLLTFKELEAV